MTKIRALAALLVTFGFGAGCSPARSDVEEVATAGQAIHSVPVLPGDTRFPAVGQLNTNGPGGPGGCSATLIAPDIVLFAAHCIADLPQGCAGFPPAYLARYPVSFTLTPQGNSTLGSSQTFQVNNLAVHPGAYLYMPLCPAGSVNSCDNPQRNANNALAPSHDLALGHLATPVPSAFVTPMQVITSIHDTQNVPGSSWVHERLNETVDFAAGSNVFATIVGWGADDCTSGPSCPNLRHAGAAAFQLGSTWNRGCEFAMRCNGTDPNSTCDVPGDQGANQPGFYNANRIAIHRIGPNGAFVGPGDSGGPLIIGRAPEGFADIPSSSPGPFVFGVASQGAQIQRGQPYSTQDQASGYASTSDDLNRPWLEATIQQLQSDGDGDGVPNASDNCPAVYNPRVNGLNTNTNLEAEIVAAQQPNLLCASCPSDGTPPADTADPDDICVSCFHARFLGDACDAIPTTGVTSRADFPVDPGATCLRCGFFPGPAFPPRTKNVCEEVPGANCRTTLNTSFQLSSWIGNQTGTAGNGGGGTSPVFCECANAAMGIVEARRQCQVAVGLGGSACVFGQDSLLGPALAGTNPSFARGFNGMTNVATNSFFIRLPNTHVEPNPFLTFQQNTTTAQWDFRPDLNRYSDIAHSIYTLTGLVWTNVAIFRGGAPPANLADSYYPLTAVAKQRFTMLWRSGLPFAPAGWLPQVGLSAGEPAWLAVSSGTPAVLALAQSREQSRIVNDLFSPAALSLLGRVADGTLEMLVGDDVIAGTPFGVPVLPVVLVRPGTNIVAAALRVSDVGVDQFASKDTSPAADPPDPRAYDALHGTLYSLYAGGSVATLTATDVRSSLAGSQTATTTPVTGATPSDAIAMAWDGIDNVLFVVDSIASSRGHAMRLLRISPSGESAELWRLKSTRQLPRVTLSVSVRNEVVLGVVSEHRTDIAVLSRFGYALQSTSVEGILSGPALGIRQGLAVPLERRPHGSNSNLALSLISSTDLSPMLCGTRWLRRHVDRSTVTPLGQPRLDCGPPHADDDDENDDD